MKELEEILTPLWDYMPDQLIGLIDEELEEYVEQEKIKAVNSALQEAAEKIEAAHIETESGNGNAEMEFGYKIGLNKAVKIISSLQIKDK